MTYSGYAILKPAASEMRLGELRGRLEQLNCEVTSSKERLEFRLRDDDGLWLTTGQLTLLFIHFKDIVGAQHHGYDTATTYLATMPEGQAQVR